MISDVLHDAIAEIERYQTDPAFAAAYSEPTLAAQIERVKAAMVALRQRLDAPPVLPDLPEGLGGARVCP